MLSGNDRTAENLQAEIQAQGTSTLHRRNPSACRGLPALPARDVVFARALHSASAGSLWIAIGVSPLPSRLIASDFVPFP